MSGGRELTEEGVQRVLATVWATWVVPELRKRIASGALSDDFQLGAFQLIVGAEGVVTEVRLNDEVRAAVRRRSRGEARLDDVVINADPEDGGFEILLTSDDPDAGHVTSIRTADGWMTSWDFRRNARQAAEHGAASAEFLRSAEAALARGDLRAFVQHVFGATELMAKAYLLTMPKGYPSGKKHRAVSAPFNMERHTGNVHDGFAGLLNRVTELRGSARYLDRPFLLDEVEARSMLATAREMYRALYDVVPKRYDAAS